MYSMDGALVRVGPPQTTASGSGVHLNQTDIKIVKERGLIIGRM